MVEHAVDVVNNLSWVIVGDLARPSCSNALSTVHQHHWYDGNVPLRLHLLVVIIQELENVGVYHWEQQLSERTTEDDTTQLQD